MSHVNVVGAVIVNEGLVLCTQRGPSRDLSGMWEFPGGKIEAGESRRSALVREIHEELRCVIDVGDEVASTTHKYAFGTITLTTFYGRLVWGTPKISEHAAMVWLPPSDLTSLDWAPADIPAVRAVVTNLG